MGIAHSHLICTSEQLCRWPGAPVYSANVAIHGHGSALRRAVGTIITPLCGGDIGHLSAAVRKTRTREPLVWEAAIHSMRRSGLGDLARHARISGAAQNGNSRLLRGCSPSVLNVRAPSRRRRGKLERLAMPPILGRPWAAWRSGAWETDDLLCGHGGQ